MTGEPTVPAPIPDLLAAIDTLDLLNATGAEKVIGVRRETAELIIRGVRDLAARVETLEARETRMREALEGIAGHGRSCNVFNGRSGCNCGYERARAALAGQSTETPS